MGPATGGGAASLSFATQTLGVAPPHVSLQNTCGVTPPCWAVLELFQVGVGVIDVKIAFVDDDSGVRMDEVELDLRTCFTVCLFNVRPDWLLATFRLHAERQHP